ncbi:NADH-quinone oxidoreductase subunit J family protein [Daejeonella lutea]|uniref:NADH-quinone oxidoreductase subunit J n=1 Tax=Daejeonella lutea TaxID=572036 RepID=A0A1T5A1K9_9SPHI|nr:NADH-quinone oxidoreductase subunit J [Daejeonella lutea]SKB28647.1 NADH-quinone oxidoreductase subunit J [Daejeonella lutea]
MSAEQLAFYFFASLTLISALLVVCMQNLVRSIFLFFVTIFSLAAMFVFALADFIAVTEVVVYVGGVLVLMLFAFMLSNKELLSGLQNIAGGFKFTHLAGLLICGGMLFLLVSAISAADVVNLSWIKNGQAISENDNTIHQIGIHTMTRYLLPFEVVSVFLMMALIGAAHLSRRERRS